MPIDNKKTASVNARALGRMRKILEAQEIDSDWIKEVSAEFKAIGLPAAQQALSSVARTGRLASSIRASVAKNTATIRVGGPKAPYAIMAILGTKFIHNPRLRKLWKPSVRQQDQAFRQAAQDAFENNVLAKIKTEISKDN